MHRARRRTLAASAAAGLLLVAGGCGSSSRRAVPGSTTTTTSATPTETYASATMTIGLVGAPTNWNPLAAGSTPAQSQTLAAVADAVLPSAFVVGPDLSVTVNADLLESARQTSSNPQQITYTIDPKAVWSDGVPVTASDFVYTWEAQSGQARFHDLRGKAYTPASTAGYSQVSSVKAGDGGDGQVVVTFRTYDPDWKELFSPLLPAQVATTVGFDRGFTDPVTALPSAGPFLVQSWQPGVDVVLVRNPLWWGRPASLAAVTVDFVTRPEEATDSLLADQLDAAMLEPDGTTAHADVTDLQADTGLTVTVSASASYDDLVFDPSGAGLGHADLRRALALAVDRKALAHTATADGDTGAAPVGNRAFLPGATGYRADGSDLGTGGLTQAKKLLVDAGYQRSATGLTHDGTPVKLTLALDTASPFSSLEAAAIRAAASSLGVTVTDVAAGTPADLEIVERQVPAFPSALASVYRTGPVQRLLATADAMADGSARDAALDRADAEAWRTAVDLPLLYVPTVLAVQSRYAGVTAVPGPDGPAYDIASWSIPETS